MEKRNPFGKRPNPRKHIRPFEAYTNACCHMDLERIKHFIEQGMNPNEQLYSEDTLHTPLTLVVKTYHIHLSCHIDWCVPYLLEKGANPNLYSGCSAIEYILADPMNYPSDAIHLLLDAGAILPTNAFESLMQWNAPDLLLRVPHTLVSDTTQFIKKALLWDNHDTLIVDWMASRTSFHECINGLTWLEYMCDALCYTDFQLLEWTDWRHPFHLREPCYVFDNVYKNEYRERFGDILWRGFGYDDSDVEDGEPLFQRTMNEDERWFPPCRWEETAPPSESTDCVYARRIKRMVHYEGVIPHDKPHDSLLKLVHTGSSPVKRDIIVWLWTHGYRDYARSNSSFTHLFTKGILSCNDPELVQQLRV